ncbi:MAG: hypothetical protein ABIK28_08755, partial [Planctomycetota bacterium]
MDGNGKAYARSTFIRDETRPEAYIEHYAALKKLSIQVAAAIEGVKSAEDEAIDAAYIALMDTLEACDDQGLDFRRYFSNEFPKTNEVLQKAFHEDLENKRGLKLKTALFLIKWGDVSEPVCQAFEEMDPRNENGYWEQLLETQVRKSDLRAKEGGREILTIIENFYKDKTIIDQDRDLWIKFIAGYINYRVLADNEAAKVWLKKSLEERCKIPRVSSTAKQYLQEIETAENKTDDFEK